ncbi:MAG: nitroreductase, partial [Chloroflexi bacterium]|nr:nitroreductase [Chloroflexota bacterium]
MDFHELIRTRYSVRSYQAREIPEDVLQRVL